jgi:hypothetical protein
MVGATRFELATSSTPRKRSTKLSHAPNTLVILTYFILKVKPFMRGKTHFLKYFGPFLIQSQDMIGRFLPSFSKSSNHSLADNRTILRRIGIRH